MHKRIIVFFILIVIIFFSLTTKANATNENYLITIEDNAEILSEYEENLLMQQMSALTEFGNVMIKTTNYYTYTSSLKYIQNYYYSKYGNKSGVAFYIDMKQRKVCACATGGLDKIITNAKCDLITDNVYNYARKGEYYKCAKEAFAQMNELLNGRNIAETMKYICNAFVSVMIGMLASYGMYLLTSVTKRTTNKELIDECEVSLTHSPVIITKTGTREDIEAVTVRGGRIGRSGGRRWFFWKWRQPQVLICFLRRA